MKDPNLQINLLKMTCKTRNNKTDCGVFTMRYMETYQGQPDGVYKTGLPKENGYQDVLLERLRKKYAHRLIMSDINILKDEILEKARQYHKNTDKESRLKDAHNAAFAIKERLKDCGEK